MGAAASATVDPDRAAAVYRPLSGSSKSHLLRKAVADSQLSRYRVPEGPTLHPTNEELSSAAHESNVLRIGDVPERLTQLARTRTRPLTKPGLSRALVRATTTGSNEEKHEFQDEELPAFPVGYPAPKKRPPKPAVTNPSRLYDQNVGRLSKAAQLVRPASAPPTPLPLNYVALSTVLKSTLPEPRYLSYPIPLGGMVPTYTSIVEESGNPVSFFDDRTAPTGTLELLDKIGEKFGMGVQPKTLPVALKRMSQSDTKHLAALLSARDRAESQRDQQQGQTQRTQQRSRPGSGKSGRPSSGGSRLTSSTSMVPTARYDDKEVPALHPTFTIPRVTARDLLGTATGNRLIGRPTSPFRPFRKIVEDTNQMFGQSIPASSSHNSIASSAPSLPVAPSNTHPPSARESEYSGIGSEEEGKVKIPTFDDCGSYTGPIRPLSGEALKAHIQVVKFRRNERRAKKRMAFLEWTQQRADLHQIDNKLKKDRPMLEEECKRGALWHVIICVVGLGIFDAPRYRRLEKLFNEFVLPVWRRIVIVRRKRRIHKFLGAVTRATLSHMGPHLTPKFLRSTGPLFKAWPEDNLQSLIRYMRPEGYIRGEYVCIENFPTFAVNILVKGTVEVMQKKPASKSKKVIFPNAEVLSTVSGPHYFNDYDVYTGTFNSISIRCLTRCLFWAIPRDVFRFQVSRLNAAVYEKVCDVFQETMEKLYVLRPTFLCSSWIFEYCQTDALHQLVSCIKPMIMGERRYLFHEGDACDGMYFIVKGRVAIVTTDPYEMAMAQAKDGLKTCEYEPSPGEGVTAVLRDGQHCGERGCIFLGRHRHSAIALTVVQAFKLPKEALTSALLQNPIWFLRVKESFNQLDELAMPKLESATILNSGLFPVPGIPRSVFNDFYANALKPRVIEAAATVVDVGAPVAFAYYIARGKVHMADDHSLRSFSAGQWIGIDLVLAGNTHWPHPLTCAVRSELWVFNLPKLLNIVKTACESERYQRHGVPAALTAIRTVLEPLRAAGVGTYRTTPKAQETS